MKQDATLEMLQKNDANQTKPSCEVTHESILT